MSLDGGSRTQHVVCVADDRQRARLIEAGSPHVGEVLVWDGTTAAPAGVERTTLLVAPYRTTPLEPQQLARMSRLRVIQLLSAGFEGWANAVPPGVILCTARGVHGSSTAEIAVTGILMHLHGHAELLEHQKRGEWRSVGRHSCYGRDVLVIGPGDIGSTVTAVLTAFGARVTLVGRTPRPGVLGHHDLAEVLPAQDIVVLSVPLTEHTRGMVDRQFLARLRPGCILVNVARGGIVVTDALVEALEARQVRAVLDVTDPEPLPPGHPLWRAPGLILTPHVGGGAEGWELRADDLILGQLNRLAEGQSLMNMAIHPRARRGEPSLPTSAC